MTTEKHRVALVGGCGTWGRFYTQSYAAHPDCEIVALVDKAKDRREQFAEHYGIPRTCDSIDELLADDVPDIVSAILPVAYIRDTVIACAEAGVKAVSCEKPIDYQLSRADETIEICRERGVAFGCGTCHWSEPFLAETVAWLREGHIGELTSAAILSSLPREVSGGGCNALVRAMFVTGMQVEWVEGHINPVESTYANPEAENETEIDHPAWGRLGLSGGITVDIPDLDSDRPDNRMSVTGENGQVFINGHEPICIVGTDPVRPAFLDADRPTGRYYIDGAVARMVEAVAAGHTDVPCNGADYHHALEIAIALTLSAHRGGERVYLPLEDRSLKLYPHPYRMYGGDQAGWEPIGYSGPPDLPE